MTITKTDPRADHQVTIEDVKRAACVAGRDALVVACEKTPGIVVTRGDQLASDFTITLGNGAKIQTKHAFEAAGVEVMSLFTTAKQVPQKPTWQDVRNVLEIIAPFAIGFFVLGVAVGKIGVRAGWW